MFWIYTRNYMANKREIKKDVNNRCYEVIYECMTFLEHTPSLNQENVYQIISEAVDLRNNLIHRINNPDGNNSNHNSRSFYNNIKKDLKAGRFTFIDRLDSLPR